MGGWNRSTDEALAVCDRVGSHRKDEQIGGFGHARTNVSSHGNGRCLIFALRDALVCDIEDNEVDVSPVANAKSRAEVHHPVVLDHDPINPVQQNLRAELVDHHVLDNCDSERDCFPHHPAILVWLLCRKQQ
jgi:hypothetical protein